MLVAKESSSGKIARVSIMGEGKVASGFFAGSDLVY